MKNIFKAGLEGIDKEAIKKMSAFDTTGLYAHNAFANLANETLGTSTLAGAGIGAVWGGGSSFINDQSFFGSVGSGAITGAMLGAGIKGASTWYSKNAAAADNFMSNGAGGYSTSFQGKALENPFRLSNFVGE